MRDRNLFLDKIKEELRPLLPALYEKRILLMGVSHKSSREKFIADVAMELNQRIYGLADKLYANQMVYEGLKREDLLKHLLNIVKRYINQANDQRTQDILSHYLDEKTEQGAWLEAASHFVYWQSQAANCFGQDMTALKGSKKAWEKINKEVIECGTALDFIRFSLPSKLKLTVLGILAMWFAYLLQSQDETLSKDQRPLDMRFFLIVAMLVVSFIPDNRPPSSAFEPDLEEEEQIFNQIIERAFKEKLAELKSARQMRDRYAHMIGASHAPRLSSQHKNASEDGEKEKNEVISASSSTHYALSALSEEEKREKKRAATRRYKARKRQEEKGATNTTETTVNNPDPDLIRVKDHLYIRFSQQIAREHMKSADYFHLVPQFMHAARKETVLPPDSKGATGIKRLHGKGIGMFELKIASGPRFFLEKKKQNDIAVLEVNSFKYKHRK